MNSVVLTPLFATFSSCIIRRAVGVLHPPLGGLDIIKPTTSMPQYFGSNYLDSPAKVPFPSHASLAPPASIFDVKAKNNNAIPTDTWNIVDGSLSCIPERYVLERTSTFVGHTPASFVASRISDCLRKRSVHAVYNTEKAKVKCFTQQFVEFRVRLFAGKADYGHGVIVEVQRRSGPATYFQEECRNIFAAAKGIQEHPTHYHKVMSRPLQQKMPPEDSVVQYLDVALELLQKDHLDAKLLGTQSLALLTDAYKNGNKTAVSATKHIIAPESELCNIIVSLIETGGNDAEQNNSDEVSARIRANSLTALCNVLKVCARDSSLSQSIKQKSVCVDVLIPSLTRELERVESSPQIALLSARCLNILVEYYAECRTKALDVGAFEALVNASEYGKSRYASLATESERGLAVLQNTKIV